MSLTGAQGAEGTGVAAIANSASTQEPPAPPDRQLPDLPLPQVVKKKIGWAVVGLGQLSLEEILPAFGHSQFSEVTALVSGHPDKAKDVAAAYGVPESNIFDYQNFSKLAECKEVDAVYIVLPNSMHAEFTIKALQAGKHVLCEKPMASTVEECTEMIAAAKEADRKLMIAYRLHYEPLNLKVMEICRDKELGQLRLFTSSNCQKVEAPNIRLSAKLAGGPVGDVGIYSINAARYVIGEEPVQIYAVAHQPKSDPRFKEVPETVAFTMTYPSGVIAQCICSFGTSESRRYDAVFDGGVITMDPAFSYRGLNLSISRPGKKGQTIEKADLWIPQISQFAAEMDHFSTCILDDKEPRTPGSLGLADMKIVQAIHDSIRSGNPVRVA